MRERLTHGRGLVATPTVGIHDDGSTGTYYHGNVIHSQEGQSVNEQEAALSLADVRRRLGRSQAEVAAAIGTTQSGVSRLERQADMLVSTLDDYIAALGGQLRLVIEHPAVSADLVVPSLQRHDAQAERREYRVIWQDHASRALVHVGWLEFTRDGFIFSYTDEARSHASFEPFPPFPRFEDTYRSRDLFPFFSVRVASAADPEFGAIIDALGLTQQQATPAELLARSSSASPHDTIQVIPEPTELPDGSLVRRFLVSGVRHANRRRPEHVSHVIQRLRPGTELRLVPEPSNPANPRALQLAAGRTVVGWVPEYLLDEIHGYLDRGWELVFEVDRANGPEVSWHLRLLCRLTAKAPTR